MPLEIIELSRVVTPCIVDSLGVITRVQSMTEEYQTDSMVSVSPSIGSLFSIIEALHDNVAIVKNDGTFLWVSPCFERTYGISQEKVQGLTTYDLEKERVFSPSVAALVLETKRMVTITEIQSNGHHNIVTGVPIYDNSGNVAFVVSYTVDPRYSLKIYAEYEKINALTLPRETPYEHFPVPGIVCQSRAMREILDTLIKLSKVDTSVLITGESGVGKNVLVRYLHNISTRACGPLVEINCAGIPDSLLESELFGYEGGAFTSATKTGKVGRIELANGGTLFLDEIGELPMHLQAKLLQVIQDKKIIKIGGTSPTPVNFRLITATNQDLQKLVGKKRFRNDLFFRLSVFPITVPPLRERVSDIAPLCEMILQDLNDKYGTEKFLSTTMIEKLEAYVWPGNVRELRNILEQLVVMANVQCISHDFLPQHMQPMDNLLGIMPSSLPEALEKLEEQLVREAYARHKTTVAVGKALGISQPTAARKILRYCRDMK